ncbi:ead/Ea22-like family protein [Klebsiella pneumoniae]|uniref:ead/Ea22-like family protein n=1 Tax=Klebsiella pneumoniae TaxID=573 RepID=UPI0017874C62|nr:ead/Ea22-like family protein [Klebsiella pneumoniae]MBD8430344.1 ead/Ea22-like family protein [Klebsiella pneumoniae]
MTDITELAQSLKAAAEKATPGQWVYFPKNTSIEYDVGSDESQGSILYVDSGDFTQAQTDRNGEFIALANPANILALVEALEYYKSREERVTSLVRANSKSWDELYRQVEAKGKRNVELVEALEKAQKQTTESENRVRKQNRHICELFDDNTALRQRIAELESRTVKLPPKVDSSNVPFAGHAWNCCLDEVEKCLAAAGIKVEAE